MSDTIIKVEKLSKRYRIGAKEQGYKTFREAIIDGLLAPIKNYGRLRKLTKFEDSPSKDQSTKPESQDDIIWALRDVSFEVKQGEVVGIIGRNGAGKTTLLKILSRITEPTAGEVKLFGRVSSLLEVGTGFHPELTGRENIYLNGAILGMRKIEIESKFDEIVDFAEIEKFIDTPVKRYSSGMYVRLAFAVAAHLEPEILLVDEVLAVGDADFQKKCLGKMGDVAKEGRTVLFVSHNMSAIRRLCPRGILLEQGSIVADGPVNRVISGYMKSGIKKMGERVWEDIRRAPGNDIVRLRAVRALNQKDEVATRFDVTEPFSVEVAFDVLKSGYHLDAGFYFNNEAGERVFIISDFQSDRWQNQSRPVGVHRSICHIPANLLNEGDISIQAHISTNPHTLHAREVDALTIQIVDDFKPGGARGNYTREWPAVAVRPLLEWSFDFVPRLDPGLDNERQH